MDHLGFGRRTMSSARHPPSNSTHKGMRQNLDRMESTVTAIPKALVEYMENFNSFCLSGVKVASLLETMFQDTPVLLLALRFREACEQLNDKCTKSSMMLQGEVVPPIMKKLAPSLSKLRSRIDGHAKALSKHESYVKQMEQLNSSQNPNKQKMEQVEAKFKASASDFAKEDSLLVEARNDVQKIRVEVMGSCFLSFLEAQSKLLTSASELIAPLGVYKEVGKGLSDSLSGTVKEATVGWLAAAQVNQNLRSFGSLSRNDVQCMLYNHRDGLPATIGRGLNSKVDQLLKKYAMALKRTPNPHHKVTGGFHLNPKGIELALRDCCSELEAIGAGAPHAETKAEKEEQIARDVPRVSYKIMGEEFGCAMGEHVEANIAEKKQAIIKLIQSLPHCSFLEDSEEQKVDEFASHILNETCTTVTNTAAKTVVQLVFGKANLIFVRPSPLSEDNHSVILAARQVDSSVSVEVRCSWWLVEDYAAFSMLNRVADPMANLGVVDVTYTLELKLQNFIKDDSQGDLPSISVTYRQTERPEPPEENCASPHRDGNKLHTFNRTLKNFLSMKGRPHSPESRSHQQHRGGRGSGNQESDTNGVKRNGGFMSYIKDEDKEEVPPEELGVVDTSSSGSSPISHSPGGEDIGERPMGGDYPLKGVRSNDSDEEDDDGEGDKGRHAPKKHSYSYLRRGAGSSRRGGDAGEGEGLGGNSGMNSSRAHDRNFGGEGSSSGSRGMRPPYPIKRYPSNESMSSQSTLVSKQLGGDNEVSSITDILRSTAPGHGLTQSNIQDHIRKENSRHYRKYQHHHRSRGTEEDYEEEDDDDDYGGRAMMGGSSSRRMGHEGGNRRSDRRSGGGSRRTKAEVKEVDEGSESPGGMVSPASERPEGTIASDSEVQNVIDFLSAKQYDPQGYKHGNDPANSEEGAREDYLYEGLDYRGNRMSRYDMVRGSGHGQREDDWPATSDGRQNDDDSGKGVGGIGDGEQTGKGGMEDANYVMMSRERNRASSKSASNSPLRGEAGDNDGEDSKSMGKEEQCHSKPRSRRKKWEVPSDGKDGRDSDGRESSEISDVFRKGLGGIIRSDLGDGTVGGGGGDSSSGGMNLLRDSPGYRLGLSLYSSMKDDSDSERSGSRESNLPVSSSSSEPQSPISTTDNMGGAERSSSRASSHSLPFSTSQNRDDDHFNHAPGARPPHSRSSGGGQHFPKFEYDDHHQYGSGGGVRGQSNSQDSGDSPWDLGIEQRNRPHYYHPYEYDLMHNRGSYDSNITHSQERPNGPLPGSRSLDDYSQPTGPPMFDRRGDHPMVLSGPMTTGGPLPPRHGEMRPGPPGQYGPPPLPGHQMPPSSQGGPIPPHMGGPIHHGRGPMPPPRGGMPPPSHYGPPGRPGPHPPHMNGGPPPGHGPHPPQWYDYDGPRIHGPPPPHHSNAVHDNRFRPVPFGGGRSNTPSDVPSPASMHSMSPGPSPHPTPPPTPPPMGGGGLPMPHHPPPPPMMPPPGGLPHPPGPGMGGPGMRIPPPGPQMRPPPWEGGPRDFRPPPPHNGMRPSMGRGPPPKMRPPMPMYMGGDARYPMQMQNWEQNNWHH